jgi:hypothetical protein
MGRGVYDKDNGIRISTNQQEKFVFGGICEGTEEVDYCAWN